jgi:hypothetical protein
VLDENGLGVLHLRQRGPGACCAALAQRVDRIVFAKMLDHRRQIELVARLQARHGNRLLGDDFGLGFERDRPSLDLTLHGGLGGDVRGADEVDFAQPAEASLSELTRSPL